MKYTFYSRLLTAILDSRSPGNLRGKSINIIFRYGRESDFCFINLNTNSCIPDTWSFRAFVGPWQANIYHIFSNRWLSSWSITQHYFTITTN